MYVWDRAKLSFRRLWSEGLRSLFNQKGVSAPVPFQFSFQEAFYDVNEIAALDPVFPGILILVALAEDLVLYRDDQAWIEGYVKKNRLYRVEPMTQELSYDGGAVNISTMRIRPRVDVHGAADNT